MHEQKRVHARAATMHGVGIQFRYFRQPRILGDPVCSPSGTTVNNLLNIVSRDVNSMAVSVLSWLLLQAFDSPATEQSSMRAPPGFSAWDQSDAFEPEK